MTSLTEENIQTLAKIVGKDGFKDSKALELLDAGFHQDNLNSQIALLPESAEQASEILRLCYVNDISIVPHGGRTGLAGGATSNSGQVILMTDRLNKVIEIDPAEKIAIVEAGVTLEELDDRLEEHNLSVGVDIGSRGTATIGGMVATNAGGMEAFRNGSMRQRILGLTAVLPDGTIFNDMCRVTKCNEGYDLKQLFCGAEGTLGIITSAVLRLAITSSDATTLLATCPSASAATNIFRALENVDELKLLRGEVMWKDYAHCIAREIGLERVLTFCDAPFYVIYELNPRIKGTDIEELLSITLESSMENGELIDLIVASNERERDEIWRLREDSFAIDRSLNDSLWYDICVPLSQLDVYTYKVTEELHKLDSEIQVYLMGHLGDGNLHATIGRSNAFTPEIRKNISSIIEGNLKQIGGSFSAEHGIGTDKRESLQAYADPEKLKLMSLIKSAIDPKGLMNPGKIFQHSN